MLNGIDHVLQSSPKGIDFWEQSRNGFAIIDYDFKGTE